MWEAFLKEVEDKYLKHYKSEILKLDESEREAGWKAYIESEKSTNPGLFYFLEEMISVKLSVTENKKIEEAIKIYKGEAVLTEPDDEISGVLACIIAIGLYGLDTPKQLTEKIRQFSAAKILSL